MKYLLIQSWKDLGGAERQAINLAEYINTHGGEAVIMCLTEPGKVSEICAEKNIKYISFQPRNDLYTVRYKILHKLGIKKLSPEEVALNGLIHALAGHIRSEGYDVCISYCAYANTVLGNAKALGLDARCIWSQRDAGFHDHIGGLQQSAADHMDASFSNSTSGSEWIIKTYGLHPELIYNGVRLPEAELDRAGWREKLDARDSDIVCTMVANLTPFKDHMFLLRTWKELIKADSRFLLVFAGKFAAAYDELIQFAEENDLLDRVRFLGQVGDIAGLWNATDICVHSARPHCEGTPNAVIEAGFFGLPVVGPNLPEIREAVSETNYSYLHEYDDINRAIKILRQIADDRKLYEKLGNANRQYVEETYDYEKNLRKIMELAGDCREFAKPVQKI